MRLFKFTISLLFSIVLVYLLNNPINNGGKDIPPMGKLLNPFTGFWQNAAAIGKYNTSSISTPSLEGNAKVIYDDRMVPHVFAKNINDAIYLQGFITAQHRLWQMDISTRATSGRLSEILGERLIERDKLQRRKGLIFAAENTLRGWEKSPKDLALLSAYTDGVNAFINTMNPSDYPVEFKLMNYEPEPWTNLKSAILIKSMALTLCSRDDDIETTNALHILGKETFDFLYPEYNPRQSPVIPENVKWQFDTVTIEKKSPVLIGQINHRSFSKPSPFAGSNNWAVSGSKTASGSPILCNDPHLNLTLPSIWFEIQLHAPDLNVYGVSLPGFPGVVIGFNENVSWGMTNTSHDVLDWYQIKWANDERTKYVIDDKVREIEFKYENFKTKEGKTIIDTVRYTQWGPIVYESSAHPQQDMAMRWISHDTGSNEIEVLQNLGHAKNYNDYINGIQGFHSPAQNIVFASRDGDIAIKIQGKLALKNKEQGRFIMDGSNSANAWNGFIPTTQNPQIKNPQRGFVSSANQNSTSPDYPYYYNGYFEDYRGRILNRLLDSLQNIKAEDLMKLQSSTYSLKAEEALPIMLQHLDNSNLDDTQKNFVAILEKWDYNYEPNAAAPILFDKWYEQLYFNIWDEIREIDDSLDILYPETWRTIALMGNDPENVFFDIKATSEKETLKDLINLSFTIMQAEVKAWQKQGNPLEYHTYKQMEIIHLGRIPAFGSGQLPVGGDGSALNAIKKTFGPSWRMVVELGDEIEAYGVYPGGQSGNPGSPFYDNMVDHWVNGKYYKLLFMKNETEQNDNILYEQEFVK